MLDKDKIPRHIAIIMDGNGRWAKLKGLSKIEGHRAGAVAVEEAIKTCRQLGIKVLSLYIFSTENWRRPKREVDVLLRLIEQYLKRRLPRLKKNKIKLLVCGQMSNLPLFLKRQIQKAINQTKDNSELTLNLALNYGGREEILQAVKELALEVKADKLQAEEINQKVFSSHLYTKGLPDPDLLIRTSGEQRLSNFFLWQASYCEFYFTDKLWPDFKSEDLLEAVLNYQKRERRFGR
ncbi:MAG: isoprenyl transferase [Omnitrophica bacterium]|nr:isoprenyl transferase [Candidatus Omnitrophota bacterium]